MKKVLFKNSVKQIMKTHKRFISILLMAFLGVGFFAGVRATSPDMKKTVDSYFDSTNMYDISIVSTLGLTDEDINAVSKVEGVDKAYGLYSEDVFVSLNGEESIVKLYAYDENINKLEIIDGKLPENVDECVIEVSMKDSESISIGDYIDIRENLGEDEDTSFKNTKLKVVGIVRSPLYISRDRGTTTLGSGKINYYMFVNKENIISDVYTEIDVLVNDAKNLDAISDKYEELIDKTINNIESIKEERQTARYNELVNEANQKLDDAQKEFDTEKQDAEKKITDAEKEIADGKKELEDGKKELEDGEKKLTENKQKFEKEIADAEAKLIDAREKVNDIETAKWYILDRYDNAGFSSYSQDTGNVEKLGQAFPIVFFFIAILISLTTMSRMVEEERIEIGTLKALGYNKRQIMAKYIMYSFLASVIGGIMGALFGLKFFPTIIIMMYQMMYDISEIIVEFDWYYAIMGIGIMTLCIVGSTIYTANKELDATPAEMMRPKAPKAGKRVLIERIPFLWNKFNFTQKVTLRNMFRYKKRFLMTVVGICGCTALILAGFGLKDSISKIMDYQYVDIYDYDMLIALKNTLTGEEITSTINNLKEKEEIDKIIPIYMSSETAKYEEFEEETQIFVIDSSDTLKEVVRLKDLKTGEELKLNDDEVIITDKLSQLLGVKVGDEIILQDTDDNEYKVKIGAITEHYISHYIYMTDNLYKKIHSEDVTANVLLAKYKTNLDENAENNLSKDILNDSKIASITLTTNLMNTMNDTLSAMNLVVYILIASAGLLAFIVLYNLSNINISERIRELATIKVLGFYDKEVYNYVTREILLLTIIGIIFGLIFGYLLNSFILGTCEINILRFKRIISPQSYIYAALITIVFTYIVNFITYFSLKKIDMIESLKTVE